MLKELCDCLLMQVSFMRKLCNVRVMIVMRTALLDM